MVIVLSRGVSNGSLVVCSITPTNNGLAKPVAYVTGAFVVFRLIAVDRTGNYRVYEGAALSAISAGGLSIQVTQPAAPATQAYTILGYLHNPVDINIVGVATVRVYFNVTLQGIIPIGAVASVTFYLEHSTKRTYNIDRSANRIEVSGSNTVYGTSVLYSDYSLQSGTYVVVGLLVVDIYGSKTVLGRCPFEICPIGQLCISDCADDRRDPSAATFTAQVSTAVIVLAMLASILFN
jgi:hypothetical protein